MGLTLLTRYGHKDCQRYGDFSSPGKICVNGFEFCEPKTTVLDVSSEQPMKIDYLLDSELFL